MSRLKISILISAYSCEPGKGSEPGVGWNTVLKLANFYELSVVTRSNNRGAIEKASKTSNLNNIRFFYYDLPVWVRKLKKFFLGSQIYYLLWQLFLPRRVNEILKSEEIDLVHHLTFGCFWMPSGLAKIPLPFVWGPVGGGELTPKELNKSLNWRGVIYEKARSYTQKIVRCFPLWKKTVHNASAVLTSTPETARILKKAGATHVIELLQMGIDEKGQKYLKRENLTDSVVCFGSVGRLIGWKGHHLSLKALAKVDFDFVYLIIGDGPELFNLKNLASGLGISEKVRFLGNLPHAKVHHELSKIDVFLHTSLHDQAPAAIFEAMMAEIPVVCLDIAGPPIQVGEEAGIVVTIGEENFVVDEISKACSKLAENPALRKRMGEAGRQRVLENFTWEKKAQQFDRIYREILGPSSQKTGS